MNSGRCDGEPETPPIYLTDGNDNLNRAAVRVLLSGVEAAPFVAEDYERVLLLFDGRDEEARTHARRPWMLIKGAGAPLSYWREGDDGGVKGR